MLLGWRILLFGPKRGEEGEFFSTAHCTDSKVGVTAITIEMRNFVNLTAIFALQPADALGINAESLGVPTTS